MDKRKCDLCGNDINGESFPVVDEQFLPQEGLVQCVTCFTGEFSLEKSIEAAKPVGQINKLAFTLDVGYLTKALREMKKNHEWRESAAILNPNPFTHNEKQDLEAAKLKQLELMLELAKNAKNIATLTGKLNLAILKEEELKEVFGF